MPHTMLRILVVALSLSSATPFVPNAPPQIVPSSSCILSKKSGGDGVENQQAFAVGSFVEFVEKSCTHIGKIGGVEHKSSGGARYQVVDSEGRAFNIPDKDVKYCMTCPNSPGQADRLYKDFCKAQDSPIKSIQDTIDVSPELIQMAWEEATGGSDEESSTHDLTPASFIELVHAHTASAMEKYLAWKLLQSEQAHIFFKEIKHNGRVVSFKAKTRKAVDNAKDVFCRTHQNDNEICFV